VPVWVWVVGALVGVAGCGALVVGGVGLDRARQAAQDTATAATVAAEETRVAQAEATGVAEERSTATALVRVTATAEAEAAATVAAQATIKAQADAHATQQAQIDATSTAEASLYAPLEEALTWPVVITDDFDYNRHGWDSGWESGALLTGQKVFVDDVYRWKMEARDDDVVGWSPLEIDALGDCYVAVDARLVEGAADAQYGVMFRLVDNANHYHFLASDDGRVQYVRRYEGDPTPYIQWARASAVRSGEVNRLAVVAKGSQFTFYVNGQHVGQHSDSRISTGQPALMVGLFDAGDTSVVEFDNFELRAP
jgi:hypothetical protein